MATYCYNADWRLCVIVDGVPIPAVQEPGPGDLFYPPSTSEVWQNRGHGFETVLDEHGQPKGMVFGKTRLVAGS